MMIHNDGIGRLLAYIGMEDVKAYRRSLKE